jgi:hypothetical protein
MGIDNQMTAARLTTAKLHAYNICQLGRTVTFVKAGTKDEFGETLTETTLDLKAHPIRTIPFTRKMTEKISWTDEVDIIAYIAKKEIDDIPLDIERLQAYKKIRIDKEYDIRYIEEYDSFGDDFLYVIVGGKL